MKEIKVESILIKSEPVQLEVTNFGSQSKQYMNIQERELELELSHKRYDGYIDKCLNMLREGGKVLLKGNDKCMLVNNYQLGNYNHMTLVDEFSDDVETTINILLYEQPIIAKDKDGILKELI